jgi:type I restriction enzyme M protein
LSENNRKKILNTFITRSDNEEYFARLVDNSEIADNKYNIAVSSYVVKKDTREVIDIKELNIKIAKMVEKQNTLRNSIDQIVAEIEGK